MAINFPDSPTLNEIALVGSSYYIWNGTSWVGYSTSFTVNYNASSIVVEGNGSPLGATTTINFSTNLTTTYDASGIATVTAAAGGGGSSQWVTTAAGIHTLSKVGIGTTNPETALSIHYGVLSFTGKGTGDDRSDISIGNSTTNSAYSGDVFALNNIFIGNKVFETKTGAGAPGYNIVIGDEAGNTLGDGCQENVIIGRNAGYINEGNANTFVGNRTGYSNKGGSGNAFYGYDAGIDNTEGGYNTFIGGEGAGEGNTTGSYNAALGSYSAAYNQTGSYNVALGHIAGSGSTNSSYNIHAGSYAGGIGTGSYNVVLGSGNLGTFSGSYQFDVPNTTKSYQLAIGIRTDVNSSRYWLVGNENFNVGIATTNPITQLQVGRHGTQTGFGTFSATVGVSTTIDTFATSFLTAEYTVHIGYGTSIQAQKVLIMNNGTTAYSQEYAIMYEPSQIVSIGATVSGSNVLLQLTPQTGVTGLTTYRFVRNTLI